VESYLNVTQVSDVRNQWLCRTASAQRIQTER